MPQFFSGKNVDEKKVFPLRGSGWNQLLAGLCILAAALASFYYKDVLVTSFFRSAGQWDETAFLLVSIVRMLFHGAQNLLLFSGWNLVGRGAAQRFPRNEDLLAIILPALGLAASFYLLPLLSPRLCPPLPINAAIVFLLMVLFQLLTLRVEDSLDRLAALLLWTLSFQSLELFSGFPDSLSVQNTATLGLAGTALFFSFLAGAVSSTWLITRYAVRVNLLRQTWAKSDFKSTPEDEGLRTISMVDVNHLAHDLKNPIAAIKGTALLLREGDSAEKGALILRATEFMENMVRELLSEDEKHTLKVSELCGTINRQIRPFPWGKDVTLTLDPEAEDISIPANRMRLLRAVFNVLDNAWRANETVGSRGVELRVRRNAGRLEIEVLDNGPGYDAERTHTYRSGWGSTGLGLAFTRRMVALHGGSLLIADRTDRKRGARVLISLPIPSSPIPSVPPAPPDAP